MQALLSAVWGVGLLIALNGARMGSARHIWHAPKTMFVFGDSFADNGNLPKTKPTDELSRQWFFPYGVSYTDVDGSGAQPGATGRFSDFMVLSDFIANMLGLPQSPPAYQSTGNLYSDPSGINFAYGDTAVYRFEFESMTVREQVDLFKRMIDSGTISHNHLTHSIALLAYSGHDYTRAPAATSNMTFIGDVTTEIAANVERLRGLGVKRVLVNNLHPLGCTPSQTRQNNYDACDHVGNKDATEHNTNLEQKLGAKKGVFIVDLNTAFGSIIGHVQHDHGTAENSELHKQFKHRRQPCCQGVDPHGFCGKQDENSKALYTLCEDPSKFFFWDDAHPTHAGWDAVMTQLEDPIKEFIGIA